MCVCVCARAADSGLTKEETLYIYIYNVIYICIMFPHKTPLYIYI